MYDVSSISTTAVQAVHAQRLQAQDKQQTQNTVTRSADRAEISDTAMFMNRLQTEDFTRYDLVNEIRSEIASGSYATDDKIDAAIEQMTEDLV